MKKHLLQFGILFAIFIGLLTACSNNNSENAKEDEKVVTIGDKTFTKDDLAFYTLMKNIQIEVNRHFDASQYSGEDLEKRAVYWKEQLNYNNNINVQLQNMIEIYAMSLLAEEKHYHIPDGKLEKQIEEYKKGIKDIPSAKKLIENYGETQFNRQLFEYTRQSMLRDRIVADLEKNIKEENEAFSEQELNYTLGQKYEELYMDQINDLVIQVHVK